VSGFETVACFQVGTQLLRYIAPFLEIKAMILDCYFSSFRLYPGSGSWELGHCQAVSPLMPFRKKGRPPVLKVMLLFHIA